MKQFLEKICSGAGDILMNYYGKRLEHREKIDAGFVTEADLKSESYIISAIKRKYPDSSILAEESGIAESDGMYRWIIDPLDGTTNFANGIPFFAVSIAVEVNNSLTAAAIYNPVSKEFFFAEKGKGFYLGDKKMNVSNVEDFSKAVLSTGDYYDRGEQFEKSMSLFERIYSSCRVVRITGSVALSLAYVAAGRFDGFFHNDPNYWDIAAGSLMVQEAGGILQSTSDKILVAAAKPHIFSCIISHLCYGAKHVINTNKNIFNEGRGQTSRKTSELRDGSARCRNRTI